MYIEPYSVGRPIRGLAILWSNCLGAHALPILFTDRIMGLKLTFSNREILLLNVYLPCDYRNIESLVSYRTVLAELSHILDSSSVDEVYLIGDMNCDPLKGRFYNEFLDFVNFYNLSIADLILPIDSFTYLSAGNYCVTSWLDHIVTASPSNVHNINILYETTIYDHFPIEFEIDLPFTVLPIVIESLNDCNIKNEFIKWNKISDIEIELYKCNLDTLLSDYTNESLMCTNQFCNSISHKEELDRTYEFIIDCINVSCSHMKSDTTFKPKQVVGWNSYCKNLHCIAREKFIDWKTNGKMRSGTLYDYMRQSRYNFKNALNFCRQNEVQIKKENILMTYNERNKTNFWKTINSIKSSNNCKINCIDGITEPKQVCEIFNVKFQRILNDPECQKQPSDFNDKLNKLQNTLHLIKEKVFLVNVNEGIDSLNCGIGWDAIHSNHIKLAGEHFNRLISRLFSSFITHSHVPEKLMAGEIRPIIKDNLKDKNSSDNYRPIMNSSNFLKLFEYCLLNKLEKFLKINRLQFGFRKHTSCLMTTAILKEIVSHYNSKGSNVYTVFVDLKKAFDKVNHKILIAKLIDKNVSPVLIKLLLDMYNKQFVNVIFNNIKGSSWKIGNGVRQGGILSPLLFNFYINDVLETISELGIGCQLHVYRCNILGYADDICILSPSANGLQFLIDKFLGLISDLSLIINENKTVCMKFTSSRLRKFTPCPKIYVNGQELDVVSEYKYLGCFITEDFKNSMDIKKCNNSFLKQFYALMHKFYFTDLNVFKFLFLSHCTSFFGSELWYDLKGSKYEYHAMEIAYHKAIKKIIGLPRWASNHRACELIGLQTFNHLINKRTLNFVFSLINSKSPCLLPLKDFLRYDSCIVKHVAETFRNVYSIDDIFDNYRLALYARINYVQATEERSNYNFNGH